jgi:uncharacterized phage-associated protein
MTAAMYTVQHVANFFLARGEAEQRSMSSLKLLKLVYIAYGWVLALTGKKLFEDDIQAWQHGPVIPALYHEFKHYGSGPIAERAVCFDLDSLEFTCPEIPESDKDTLLILDRVWDAYKGYSAWSLRNKTHAEDGPWHSVYNELERDTVIPDSLIADYFRHRIGEYLNVEQAV